MNTSTYTITPAQLRAMAAARALQVARARNAARRETGADLPAGSPERNAAVAHVAFVNGATWRAAVPVKMLAAWAAFFRADVPLAVSESGGDGWLTLCAQAGGGTSRLRVRAAGEIVMSAPWGIRSRRTSTRPLSDLPELRLVAPEGGGAFVLACADEAAEKAARRAERTAAARLKAGAEHFARKAELWDAARKSLARIAGAHEVMKETTFAEAVNRAKAALAVARVNRQYFANFPHAGGGVCEPACALADELGLRNLLAIWRGDFGGCFVREHVCAYSRARVLLRRVPAWRASWLAKRAACRAACEAALAGKLAVPSKAEAAADSFDHGGGAESAEGAE